MACSQTESEAGPALRTTRPVQSGHKLLVARAHRLVHLSLAVHEITALSQNQAQLAFRLACPRTETQCHIFPGIINNPPIVVLI